MGPNNRAGNSHREDLWKISTPKYREYREQVLTMCKIFLKINVLGFIFSNAASLHLQSLLRNEHLLRHFLKTRILRTSFSSEEHLVAIEIKRWVFFK